MPRHPVRRRRQRDLRADDAPPASGRPRCARRSSFPLPRLQAAALRRGRARRGRSSELHLGSEGCSMKPRIAILADVRNWAWARRPSSCASTSATSSTSRWRTSTTPSPDPMPKGATSTTPSRCSRRAPAGRPALRDRHDRARLAHLGAAARPRHGAQVGRRRAGLPRQQRLLEAEMRALLERPICYVPERRRRDLLPPLPARAHERAAGRGLGRQAQPAQGIRHRGRGLPRAGVELRTDRAHAPNALTPEQMREFYQDLHVLASPATWTARRTRRSRRRRAAWRSCRTGSATCPSSSTDGVERPARRARQGAESIAAALRELGRLVDAVRMGEAARATVEARAGPGAHGAELRRDVAQALASSAREGGSVIPYEVIVSSVHDRADLLERTLRSMLPRSTRSRSASSSRGRARRPARRRGPHRGDPAGDRARLRRPDRAHRERPGTGLALAMLRLSRNAATEFVLYTQEDFDFVRPCRWRDCLASCSATR
jgi:hypothetical protein